MPEKKPGLKDALKKADFSYLDNLDAVVEEAKKIPDKIKGFKLNPKLRDAFLRKIKEVK